MASNHLGPGPSCKSLTWVRAVAGGEQVLLGVPRGQDRCPIRWVGPQLAFEFGDQVTGPPHSTACQEVAQLPLAVALASASTADAHGDPAADLGHGRTRQLHEMEMIDDELGVGSTVAPDLNNSAKVCVWWRSTCPDCCRTGVR